MVFRNIYCIQTQNLVNATFVRVHIYSNPLIIIILLGSTWPSHIGVVLHDIPGTVDKIESTWWKPHGRWRDIIMSCFLVFAIFIINLCVIMNTPVKRVMCFGWLNSNMWRSSIKCLPLIFTGVYIGKNPSLVFVNHDVLKRMSPLPHDIMDVTLSLSSSWLKV
jgi:hypothetical protein